MSFPKIEGYVVTEKLGTGSYSTVYKAYTKVGARTTVAIKCIDKSRIKHSGTAIDNLVTEIRLLKTLTHPHIVHMQNFTWDDKNIYIIMEYCCGGDLSKYIRRYGRVPEKQVLYFLQQLASALKFLREKGVVHMDLKPHNLLLHKGSDGKYSLKVADFGFAQHMSDESSRHVRGSPLYMAPEMLLGEHDARVDLWSVGVIMYECLFGRAPYSSATFNELIDKIQRKAPIEIPANASISAGCRDLLTRLLQHEPAQRISYEEFFAHDYLDLDHMPTKDNYNKAVSLIKLAIELECAGRLPEALTAYSDSLRYLVPTVSAESDPVRRSALAAKLRQYMDRAEEIKRIVKGQSSPTPTPCDTGTSQRPRPTTQPTPCDTGTSQRPRPTTQPTPCDTGTSQRPRPTTQPTPCDTGTSQRPRPTTQPTPCDTGTSQRPRPTTQPTPCDTGTSQRPRPTTQPTPCDTGTSQRPRPTTQPTPCDTGTSQRPRPTTQPTPNVAEHNEPSTQTICEQTDVRNGGVDSRRAADAERTGANGSPTEVKSKPQDKRGALARLLRRPVPPLDKDTTDESQNKCQRNDEPNDTCKIN